MTEPDPAGPVDPSPTLVLRRAGPDDPGTSSLLRWELVDPWAPPDRPPAAVAETSRRREAVCLTGIGVATDAPAGALRCLVQQLVATLRRTDAAVVLCSLRGPEVGRELIAAGFVGLPEQDEVTGAERGPRMVLQL